MSEPVRLKGTTVGSSVCHFFLTIFIGTTTVLATEKITVFHAGSLAVPLAQIETDFEAANPGVNVLREAGGSTKMARMISELGKPADIMASADFKVIDKTLIPKNADWNIRFATNVLVLCYTEKSRYADQITADNWWRSVSSTSERQAGQLSSGKGRDPFFWLAVGCSAVVVTFIVLPLFEMMTQPTAASLKETLMDRGVIRSIRLSILTSGAAALVSLVFGTPLAYLLARRRFPGKKILESVIDLPIMIPHPVVGIALLSIAGRNHPVGRRMQSVGIERMGMVTDLITYGLKYSQPVAVWLILVCVVLWIFIYSKAFLPFSNFPR